MAAAIMTGRTRNLVAGHLRGIIATGLQFLAAGDTFTVPGMKIIYSIDVMPQTPPPAVPAPPLPYTFQITGNVLTLVATAGMTFGAVTIMGL
jgi:hypothetical protein